MKTFMHQLWLHKMSFIFVVFEQQKANFNFKNFNYEKNISNNNDRCIGICIV
ncbi:MAG: hypothetical protein ACI9Y7_000591 [Dokdonia sp.]|jgi:hypothetical protein